jgi:hypothetical protein
MSDQKNAELLYEAVQKLTRAVLLCTGAIIAKRYTDEELFAFSSRKPFYFGDEKLEDGIENAVEKWAREAHDSLNNWEFPEK